MRTFRVAAALLSGLGLVPSLLAQQPSDSVLRRDLLHELIEINTSDSAGHTREAAEAMARRLLAVGFQPADVQVVGHHPRYQNLVARYRGSGTAKPILLMAHLDVVDARREDWSFDPYVFREADGWYYGRGSSDNKAGAAMLVANFLRLKREGFVPDRDLIIVLSADEETNGDAISWLVRERRDLVDADYALNTDGGGGDLVNGKAATFTVQTAEKVYLTFQLEVRNKGGHSSVPPRDNAIYRLSEGLARLSRFSFPMRLNETTRAFLLRSAPGRSPAEARDMQAVARRGDPDAARRMSAQPYGNALLRTTCVATRLSGGHADNALPQVARATVNCRMLPDHPPDSVEATLRRVLADTAIVLTRINQPHPSPPSPLRSDVMEPVERLAAEMWPGAAVVPEMSMGATDGLFTRNAGIPTYGVSAIFSDPNDVRAHGRDERVGVKAFHDAAEFWYRLVKTLTRPDLKS
ncbi:MAG TPA: M20/M25/M40 family metallo-hydrolase [Gemmatimonadales bacterium]|jgi:acetylornithine deacetylase/succinyl-diaminopimelate desuccinylase-like protein|nr:M20/M25/M40 family metallo-hydrolase [Gemmatimonadales bacterium]